MALTDKLSAIGNAIRAKTGKEDLMTLEDMPAEIESISGGTSLPTQEKSITITENGTVEVLPDEGYALSKVTANAQVYDAVDDRFAKFIEGTSTEIYDPIATSIRAYAFYKSPFTSVTLPNATKGERYCLSNATSLKTISLEALKEAPYNMCTNLGNLETVSLPALTTIVGGEATYSYSMFEKCTSLRAVDMSSLVEIPYSSNGIFNSCTSLTSVHLPNLETIAAGYTFKNCTALKSLELPKLKTIRGTRGETFSGCTSLTSVYLPEYEGHTATTDITTKTFFGCTALTTVSFPKLIKGIGSYAFSGCTALTDIDFPSYDDNITSNMFNGCTSLKNVNVANCEGVQASAFDGCVSLEKLNPKITTSIGAKAFRGCSKLSIIALNGNYGNVVTLSNISAFEGTPFYSDGIGGICLVPRDLIESYQNATNWSTLYAAGTCLFWALEDYTVDGTIEGEIDWDKLNTDREGAFA